MSDEKLPGGITGKGFVKNDPRINRKCRAVEISPAYVAVALERWSQLTCKTPELLEA